MDLSAPTPLCGSSALNQTSFVCEQNDWTPLHHAASNGHEGVVQVVIAAGADKNARDSVSS